MIAPFPLPCTTANPLRSWPPTPAPAPNSLPASLPPSLPPSQVVGEYHLGTFVNRFRHGSLVMRLPDSELAGVPTLLWGAVDGTLGLMASLPPQLFGQLQKLQVGRARGRA